MLELTCALVLGALVLAMLALVIGLCKMAAWGDQQMRGE